MSTSEPFAAPVLDPSVRVAVTGATGYIGGRLVPRLLEAGCAVRCLARAPRKLADRPWARDPRVEIVQADLGDLPATEAALVGCGPAYFLVHSMVAAGADYAEHDRRLARNFAEAGARAGLSRIVYLGGLGEMGEGLSEHLASRREVEHVLAAGSVPVTVLRAAMIIGSGSASFEILRYLVERLPVMVTPRWVRTECQPIAAANVLHYLVACLGASGTAGRTLDIGGPDVVTYLDLMRIMAQERGLPPRWIIPVPVLTPRLSALWIHLVTPLSHRIAIPLSEGLKNRVVCRDDEAARLMPQPLMPVREAIRAALEQTRAHRVETVWSAAGRVPGDPAWSGGTVFTDRAGVEVEAPPEEVFRTVCGIGGRRGWYAAQPLWRLRGAIDRLVGGPGLSRGRRDPEWISFGEALDFWRVADVVPGRRLVLLAEMKLPGEGFLEFDVEPVSADGVAPRSRLTQTARFRPKGLLGLAYWYSMKPLHNLVFRRMLSGIRREAERRSRAGGESARPAGAVPRPSRARRRRPAAEQPGAPADPGDGGAMER